MKVIALKQEVRCSSFALPCSYIPSSSCFRHSFGEAAPHWPFISFTCTSRDVLAPPFSCHSLQGKGRNRHLCPSILTMTIKGHPHSPPLWSQWNSTTPSLTPLDSGRCGVHFADPEMLLNCVVNRLAVSKLSRTIQNLGRRQAATLVYHTHGEPESVLVNEDWALPSQIGPEDVKIKILAVQSELPVPDTVTGTV